jgi:hypothetical protein
VRLVREVPEVKAVRGTVEVSDVGTVPIVHTATRPASRSRSSNSCAAVDSYGRARPTAGASRSRSIQRATSCSWEPCVMPRCTRKRSGAPVRSRGVRQVRQDIKVMERDLQQ